MPSHALTSIVPQRGAGRMSQRTSLASSMTPVPTMSAMYDSNSDQFSSGQGSPAVGSCWNTSERLEA